MCLSLGIFLPFTLSTELTGGFSKNLSGKDFLKKRVMKFP
jgi:hypothetical protein